MNYWLLKSEPEVFGWTHQLAAGERGAEWFGVRNYQARNNMRAMALGDRAFFYHSSTGKEIVGVVEVSALSHPDSTTDDPRWDCVDVRAVGPFERPVTLSQCREDPALREMVLVNNTRLSVQPVTEAEWLHICRLGGFRG
jgi:predicted RNA-binding protein with PUA-like domain